jgi:hypothetical protein
MCAKVSSGDEAMWYVCKRVEGGGRRRKKEEGGRREGCRTCVGAQ